MVNMVGKSFVWERLGRFFKWSSMATLCVTFCNDGWPMIIVCIRPRRMVAVFIARKTKNYIKTLEFL